MRIKKLRLAGAFFLLAILVFSIGVFAEITSYQKSMKEEEYSVNKINEVTPYSLARGVNLSIGERDAIRFPFGSEIYNIYFIKVSGDEVIIDFPGNREVSVTDMNAKFAVDLNQDGFMDLDFRLNGISDGILSVYVREFMPNEYVSQSGYFELFDVTLQLEKNLVYSPQDLNVYVKFENFGNVTSEVNIKYKIFNESGAEIYEANDIRSVQTEETVTKNFGFLTLPAGKYKIDAQIFYGKNQTADSEKTFEIAEEPFMDKMAGPIIFVIFLVLLAGILLVINRARKKQGKKEARKVRRKKKR